jgi:hypothetical protein
LLVGGPLHWPLLQSEPAVQCFPVPHRLHGVLPPQSMSLSPPSVMPSMHELAWHTMGAP